MMRVVIDTNVYISALMFGGLPGSLLDLVFLQSFVLIVSPAILDELGEKLRFPWLVRVRRPGKRVGPTSFQRSFDLFFVRTMVVSERVYSSIVPGTALL